MTYIIVEWSGGGGLGHYSFLLADGLARRGVRTILATRQDHELKALPHAHEIDELWPRGPRRLRGRPRTIAIALGWLSGWLRLIALVIRARRKPDLVVHVQAPERGPELVFLALLRILSPCLVITAHNAVPHDYATRGARMHRLTYRLPHVIVTQTKSEAANVRSIAGGRPLIVVIPHGSYAPIADWAISETAVRDERITIAHLGSIRPYKGFDLVVAAFGLARADDERLRLRVVGRAADEEATRALLDTLPAEAVSTKLGYATIEELVRESRDADVVFLGHRRASESGVLHLALATGTPVIGPNIAGIASLLAFEPTWAYAASDVTDAARAITELAATFPTGRDAARRRARELVEQNVPSWDSVARAHLDFASDWSSI